MMNHCRVSAGTPRGKPRRSHPSRRGMSPHDARSMWAPFDGVCSEQYDVVWSMMGGVVGCRRCGGGEAVTVWWFDGM